MRPGVQQHAGRVDDRVQRAQAAGQHIGYGRDAREERRQPLVHVRRLCGRKDAKAHRRHHAPDRGAIRLGLAADIRRGVGLRDRDRGRPGVTQDARHFQRPERAGHERERVAGSDMRREGLRPRRVAIGRHDQEQGVRGGHGGADVVSNHGDVRRANVRHAVQFNHALLAHGLNSVGKGRQLAQGHGMPGQRQVGRRGKPGIAGAQHGHVRRHWSSRRRNTPRAPA